MVEGVVTGVTGHTHVDSGSRIGVLRKGTGQSSGLEIKVESNSPVEKLTFGGCWSIEKGDTIRAYINMIEKVGGGPVPVRLVPREESLQSVESPSKIEKIRDGEIVATYIST